MKAFGFRPKLYTALKNYSKELFMADLMAMLSFEDELERNNYIEAVASAYKVSKESLEKLVAKTAV